MASANCPGTNAQPLPLVHLEDGWPHGSECPECHGFYVRKKNGNLRAHKPHAGDNAFMAPRRAQLDALRECLRVDPIREAVQWAERLEPGARVPSFLQVWAKDAIARRDDIDRSTVPDAKTRFISSGFT